MKRITLFCGHYGSGKTNIAVNYAKFLKNEGKNTAICDLDIVNPYFRTKDSEQELTSLGIRVISLPFANTNVDLPTIPSESYSLLQNKNEYAVFDIGGDDRGAYALGGFAPYIKEENNYDMLCVINFYRPLTQNAEEAMEVLKEIEAAASIKFTGLVNNSNLGALTSAEDVIKTFYEAEKLSSMSGLPIKFVAAKSDIAEKLSGKAENIFPLCLQKKITD